MELQLINNEQTMTSIDLLKVINEYRKEIEGKEDLRYDNFMAVVRDEFEEEISCLKIQEKSMASTGGRTKKYFNLTYSQCKQLLVRESKHVRKAVIKRLEELEGAKPKQLTVQELLEQTQAMIEVLKRENEIMTPKAEFFDAVADSKTAIDIATCAKVLDMGMGRNVVFSILRRKGILMNDNIPYQKYMDLGYFRVVEQKYTKPDGSVHISYKTLVYQKGLDFIRKTLLED